jgi:hypothetical protein
LQCDKGSISEAEEQEDWTLSVSESDDLW